MSSVKANETFACEFGLFHQGTELDSDTPVVRAFPQFFDPIDTEPAPAVKRGPGRPPKTTTA